MSFDPIDEHFSSGELSNNVNADGPHDSEFVIEVNSISKGYHAKAKPARRLKEVLLGLKPQPARMNMALDDVSFTLNRGDRLGIVGENGSGKSTLLKLLSGVLTPTSGGALVRGRVSALLELGTGFNPDLTGRENISQFCRLHGLSSKQTRSAIDPIIRFSELGAAIDQPIRTYSSGETVRLGFSCAVHVDPDILIVDEALSVGDAYFQVKCLNKIQSMLREDVTFLYVTHSADGVRSLCNKGLWLDHGCARMWGDAKDVGDAYQSEMFRRISAAGLAESPATDLNPLPPEGSKEPAKASIDPIRAAAFADRVKDLRQGSGELLIDDVVVLSPNGEATDSVNFEDEIRIRIFYTYKTLVESPIDLGVGIVDSRGIEILHHSLATVGLDAREIGPGSSGSIDLTSKNVLCPGEFSVNIGANTLIRHPTMNGRQLVGNIFDYCVGSARFSVRFPNEKTDKNFWGIVRSEFDARINSPINSQ